MLDKKAYTVLEVTNYIKSLFDRDFVLRQISVRGEVSNCKYNIKGHIYFTIKDDDSVLPCVLWASKREAGLDFTLEDGQEIVVTGRIGVYPPWGDYRLYAESIQRYGLGKLFEEYEKLKAKLKKEGLFDESHKKKIPRFPNKIGIITSRTGAVIEDIKRIAKESNPFIQLVLYPAQVQGRGAAETLIKGIKRLKKEEVDTIIIGRGGGSFEDLWCFNDEDLVREVYNCETPIISAIGHETDFTLTDFVSDCSVPTPTAAAATAVPNRAALLDELRGFKDGFTINMKIRLERAKSTLKKFEFKIRTESPRAKLNNFTILLEGYNKTIKNNIENKLSAYKNSLSNKNIFINREIKQTFEQTSKRFLTLAAKLEGASPMARLMGGYAYVENDKKENIRSVKMIKINEMLNLVLSDGNVRAKVEGIEVGNGSKES